MSRSLEREAETDLLIGFGPDYNLYPKKDKQYAFFKSYLRSAKRKSPIHSSSSLFPSLSNDYSSGRNRRESPPVVQRGEPVCSGTFHLFFLSLSLPSLSLSPIPFLFFCMLYLYLIVLFYLNCRHPTCSGDSGRWSSL